MGGLYQAKQALMFLPNLLELRFGMSDPELQLLERSIIGPEMRLDNLANLSQPLCRLDEGLMRTEPYNVMHDVVRAAETSFRGLHLL